MTIETTLPTSTTAAPSPAAATEFRVGTLALRIHGGRGSRICFVVFDPMVDDPSLDRTAFGERFFAAYGYDAVHILASQNNWYQDPGLPDVLARARMATRGYDRVITYGSSMGGYAALRFARQVEATLAIAISPQYSVLPAVAPQETRWPRMRQGVQWLHEKPGDRLQPIDDALILHDDRGADAWHAAAILRDLPHARSLPITYGGHPVGAVLAELGLLASIVVDAAEGRLDVDALRPVLRRERRRSGNYLFTLARRQPIRRLRMKGRLAARAVAAAPDEPVYLSYAGLVMECLGRPAEALDLHRRATVRPAAGIVELRHARALWRAGLAAEARPVAERARPLLPRDGAPSELLALMQAMAGAPAAALAVLAGDPRLRDRARLSRWMLAVAEAPWMRSPIAARIGRCIARALLGRTVLDPRNIGRELATADQD